MNRRFFLFAAPAIVAAPSLMKVSAAPCSAEYRGFRLVALHPGAVSVVRNPIWYGVGIYSGYDGYEIIPSDWERVSQEITGISDLMRGTQSA